MPPCDISGFKAGRYGRVRRYDCQQEGDSLEWGTVDVRQRLGLVSPAHIVPAAAPNISLIPVGTAFTRAHFGMPIGLRMEDPQPLRSVRRPHATLALRNLTVRGQGMSSGSPGPRRFRKRRFRRDSTHRVYTIERLDSRVGDRIR